MDDVKLSSNYQFSYFLIPISSGNNIIQERFMTLGLTFFIIGMVFTLFELRKIMENFDYYIFTNMVDGSICNNQVYSSILEK